MNPFGTRGAAGELAQLLDAPWHPGTVGPALAPSLAVAGRLRELGRSLEALHGPRPEFRTALRTRLVAVATVQAQTATAGVATGAVAGAPVALPAAVSWRSRAGAVTAPWARSLSGAARARRGGAVAAGALATVVGVTGVAVAGSQSLPGDPFYDVKRGVEALQVATADGAVEEGGVRLDQAATRLREVRGLVLGRDAARTTALPGAADLFAGGQGTAPLALVRVATTGALAGGVLAAADAALVADTLADMDDATREGSALLVEAARTTRTSEPLTALATFATRQELGLVELLPALPPAVRADARTSLALVEQVGDDAEELLAIGACGPACDPTGTAPAVPTVPSPATPTTAGVEPGTPAGPAPDAPDCRCATPQPQPTPEPQPTAAPRPTDEPSPSATPSRTPSPRPSPTPSTDPTPSPSSSPSSGPLPLPLPVPVPVPPLPLPPLPLPTPTLPPLLPTLAPALPAALPAPAPARVSSTAPLAPAPAPAPAPLPALPTVLAPRL